jgi:hypothetical protein
MNDLLKRKHPKTFYFFDTEFAEHQFLSIGIVCADGREFYRENADADWSKAGLWVRDNVLPHMHGVDIESRWVEDGGSIADGRTQDILHPEVMSTGQIAMEIQDFVRQGEHVPEFWAYYADYDWWHMCELYGGMLELPRSWPQFCLDLVQECYLRGIYDPKNVMPVEGTEHNALDDARWNLQLFNFLAGVDT